jgi:hypothetical protein
MNVFTILGEIVFVPMWCTLIRHGVRCGLFGCWSILQGEHSKLQFCHLGFVHPLYNHVPVMAVAEALLVFFFHPFGAPMELEGSQVMEDRRQGDDRVGEGDDSMGWESRGGPCYCRCADHIQEHMQE